MPEFCEMTGLTDENRANFNLMKEMAQVLHKDGARRQAEVVTLLNEMRSFPKVKKIMDEWKLEIDPNPLKVKGQQINPGNILLGNDRKFPADCNANDFDRNI